MRFLPLGVSCPGSTLRLFSVRGGSGLVLASPCLAPGGLSPRAWASVSGAVWRLGGHRGMGGGGEVCCEGGWPSPCVSPPGGLVVLELAGGARGVAGCGAAPHAGRFPVRPSASPARAPRVAPTASPRPWRVQSPYCSGSRPCASAWALLEGGVVGRPGAVVGDWQGPWLAG